MAQLSFGRRICDRTGAVGEPTRGRERASGRADARFGRSRSPAKFDMQTQPPAAAAKTMVMVEGLATQPQSPDHGDVASPFVREWIRDELGPEAAHGRPDPARTPKRCCICPIWSAGSGTGSPARPMPRPAGSSWCGNRRSGTRAAGRAIWRRHLPEQRHCGRAGVRMDLRRWIAHFSSNTGDPAQLGEAEFERGSNGCGSGSPWSARTGRRFALWTLMEALGVAPLPARAFAKNPRSRLRRRISGSSVPARTVSEKVNDPPAVLFVCLGSICRSPMAEGHSGRSRTPGLDVAIDSAEPPPIVMGEPPDPRAQATARARSGNRASARAPAGGRRFRFHPCAGDGPFQPCQCERSCPRFHHPARLLLDLVAGRGAPRWPILLWR